MNLSEWPTAPNPRPARGILERIATEDFAPGTTVDRVYPEFTEDFCCQISQCPLIRLDTLKDHVRVMYTETPAEGLPILDVMPPYPWIWIEGEVFPKGSCGAMFNSWRNADGDTEVLAFGAIAMPGKRVVIGASVTTYTLDPDGNPREPVHKVPRSEYGFAKDAEHCFLVYRGIQTRIANLESGKEIGRIERAYLLLLATSIHHMIDTQALFHCRNVVLRECEPVERDRSRKLDARIGRRDGGWRYSEIRVRKPGQKQGEGVSLSHALGDMPLHRCRAHYACYGPQYGRGLLFGQYEGKYLIPAHLRGKSKNGIVDSSYRITE